MRWFKSTVLLCILMLTGILASCSGDSSSIGFITNNESLRIYEMTAGNGSFSAVAGDSTGTRFQLNLGSVPASVLYFTDRPVQETGYDTVFNVMNNIWPRVYGTVAPNVLLQATVANQGTIDLFCMLEKPVYNAATGQLSFNLTYLNGNQKPISNLSVTDVKMIILNNAASAQVEEWSQVMSGSVGTFSAPASDGTSTITLQQPYSSVFSYTSAPARKSTIIPLNDFMQTWQARFGSVLPNISFAYNLQSGQTGGVQIVTVTKTPAYDAKAGTITFTAKILYGTVPIGTGGLRVTALSLFVDGGLPTYSEADLKTLTSTGSCANCNLSGADLSGKDLTKANLSGTTLQAANLNSTVLKQADLTNADLTGAAIANANMVGATLLNTIGPTGMAGRVVNLVNNCSTDIWAAASGNTMAVQCRTSAECNGGVCPPLTGNCITDQTCKNLCTTYPCGSNGDCSEPNTYCGGLPSFNTPTSCTKDTDCGANLFCNVATGQCGWKNCTYIPIPVENTQIVIPAVSCTKNKDCSGTQFCYTTNSTTGLCATLPDATKGNSWKLGTGGATPLFIPTPWAGRFWPRTGCSVIGSPCDPLFAGSDAQCGTTAVNPADRKLMQPLANPQQYPVNCRVDNDCGPSATNKTVVGGQCNLSNTPNYDPGQQHTTSECTIGNDSSCDAVKGTGSNYVCIAEKTSSGGLEVTIGVCGYRQCTAYQCSNDDGKGNTNICSPATVSCDTGSCYDEQVPSQRTLNCRQSGLDSPTLAELNMPLSTKGSDFYDISLVDGANVPVQIAPVTSTYIRGTTDEIQPDKTCSSDTDCWNLKLDYNWVCDTGIKQCVNRFYCGSPGCVSDCTTYGRGLTQASTWGGSNLVIAQNTCPKELQLTNAAGTYVGCLSPLKACGPDHKGDPSRTALSCDTNLNMFQCTGAVYGNSCYTAGVGSSCCGYPDWMGSFGTVNKIDYNDSWRKTALPYYKLFHTASPASYTYPYDDKSGTFTCKGKSDAVNVNYNITFCPK
jgi:hypothetical protein